jgi:hypothetical protein
VHVQVQLEPSHSCEQATNIDIHEHEPSKFKSREASYSGKDDESPSRGDIVDGEDTINERNKVKIKGILKILKR